MNVGKEGEKMNASSAEAFLRTILPDMGGGKHKGQGGRIGVLGGSVDYAGAPYFSGMSALRSGAELLYLFTAEEATVPIKSYSPELMVSGAYRWSKISSLDPKISDEERARFVKNVTRVFPRLHALVVGPGLGRDPSVLRGVEEIMLKAKDINLPLVVDADGMFLVTSSPRIMKDYKSAVLTPNAAEYRRLSNALMGTDDADIVALCRKLSGPLILRKGLVDEVASVDTSGPPLACRETGSLKRPGGLGDILSGAVAVFLAWGIQRKKNPAFACLTACALVRRASREAYRFNGRSMLATDVLENIGGAFRAMCPVLGSGGGGSGG